eukprot:3006735-Pyramimonas_sp.AAC.1
MVFDGCLRSRHFGLPTLQDGPRGTRDCPSTAERAPEKAPRQPRGPQDGSSGPWGGPRRTPGRPHEGAQKRGTNVHFELSVPRSPRRL